MRNESVATYQKTLGGCTRLTGWPERPASFNLPLVALIGSGVSIRKYLGQDTLAVVVDLSKRLYNFPTTTS